MPQMEPQSDGQSQPKATRVRISDLPRRTATEFISAYANNTNAAPSFYELTLQFGQIVTPPAGEAYILDRAAITMTWEHALRLNALLELLLKNYQQDHETGAIRLMKDSEVETAPDKP